MAAASCTLALRAAAFGCSVVAVASRLRRVHLYTFSDTVPHPGLCALAEATSELGGILRVIGLSKRPGYILIHSHSPTLKFLMLQEVVEYEVHVGRIAPDDLMIFADGHDVLLQRPLTELLAAYERWPSSPYLISGEKNCWPWPHSDPSHGKWDPGMEVAPNTTFQVHQWLQISAMDLCRAIPQKGPYRYPNIGLSMGPVALVLEVLRRNNRIVLDEDVNDQGAMWLVIVRHAPELNIQIDQNAEVFLNMLQYEAGELEREPCGDDWFAQSQEDNLVSSFFVTGLAQYCANDADIRSAETCREAAAHLGFRWRATFDGPGDHRSCLLADDGRDEIFFNTAGASASRGPTNRFYRSVCQRPPGGSAGDRRPPRNLLTNTTPSMLHFNGPSHEDGVWPTCYHAWTDRFRAKGRGHGFLDVDHDYFLSTDELCDYGFYRIHNFHSHPVHEGTLRFLKDFYDLPTDPGLLAWRGSTSAVDAARLGREEDLQPHLQRRILHATGAAAAAAAAAPRAAGAPG